MVTFQKFDINQYSDALIVTDANLAKLYGFGGENVFILPVGERAKTFAVVQKLCKWFLDKDLQKDGMIVSVGGGCVGDATGFAASIYKRGVKLLHVPTTLIAQIDSSIGGKTALNIGSVKNAVGTFYNADTLIDTAFLNTLPKARWKNGQGELLKYRMLSAEIDDVFYGGNFDEIVKACADYKQQICLRDPLDENVRRLLNFGHTVGHALELTYKLPHGEAVANGLYYETALSQRLGLCDVTYAKKWQSEVAKLFTVRPLTREILSVARHDKKNSDGLICCVLPAGGDFVLRNFTLRQFTDILLSIKQ